MPKKPEAGISPEDIEREGEKKVVARRPWGSVTRKGKRKGKRGRAASARPTREANTRASEPVHDEMDAPWVRPSSLNAPPPRPGMVQRWIRVGSKGKDDAINLSRKMREGWQPRPANSVPSSFAVPALKTGQFAGAIGVEGMVLMEMRDTRNTQRNEYYAGRKGRMTESINAQLVEASRNRGTGFGPITKATTTKFVREAPPVQADE